MSRPDNELAERRQAIRWYRSGVTYTTICRRLDRSRPWLAKWVARFKAEGWAGLRSRSRRPRRLRQPLPARVAARIVVLRTELEAHQTRRSRYRGVGALEIQELLRAERRRPVPSLRTIERVLRAQGCGRQRRTATGGSPPYPAPRATRPGDLVQTDLVGPRYLRGRRRAVRFYSLHSIAVVGRGTWTSQHRYKTRDAFCAHFLGSWGHLGVPRVSQVDNEMAATGGGRHAFGLSAVMRLHLLVGSHLLFVPPGEPGRNHLVESFNGVWQDRVLTLEHPDLRHLSRASHGYWRFYHERKPHRALTVAHEGTRFPGEWLRLHRDQVRWLPAGFSLVPYRGRRGHLPVARGRVSWIQRVDANGQISINARPYFIGTRRTGEYVQATLFTHRQRLVIYAANRRRLKTFRFPIHERVIDPVL